MDVTFGPLTRPNVTFVRTRAEEVTFGRQERASVTRVEPTRSDATFARPSRVPRAQKPRGTNRSYDASRSRCASGSASSFFSVWFSIWRMRSRVTLNARPTSSSV